MHYFLLGLRLSFATGGSAGGAGTCHMERGRVCTWRFMGTYNPNYKSTYVKVMDISEKMWRATQYIDGGAKQV